MYYEINVSKLTKRAGIGERYEHYFATAKRSITFYEDACEMLKEFQKIFPAPEFNITISEVPEQYKMYTPEEFLNEFEKRRKNK